MESIGLKVKEVWGVRGAEFRVQYLAFRIGLGPMLAKETASFFSTSTPHITYSPPQVDRVWGIWGLYSDLPEAIFHLLKGDYRTTQNKHNLGPTPVYNKENYALSVPVYIYIYINIYIYTNIIQLLQSGLQFLKRTVCMSSGIVEESEVLVLALLEAPALSVPK